MLPGVKATVQSMLFTGPRDGTGSSARTA